MKTLILILLLFIPTVAHADWYIMKADSTVIGRSVYQPNVADLNTRGDFAIQSNETIPIGQADYRNGQIVQHVPTSAEVSAQQAIVAQQAAQATAKASAIAKFKALGLTDAEIGALLQ